MFRTFDSLRDPGFTSTWLDYDVLRSDEGVTLHIDLPGVDPDSIDLTIDGRSLSLAAERNLDVPEGATLVSRRRTARSISQRFHLGERLDSEGLNADYRNGVLIVDIPVAESAKPRKVLVGTGSGELEAA